MNPASYAFCFFAEKPPPPPKFPLKPKPPSKHQLLMEQIKAFYRSGQVEAEEGDQSACLIVATTETSTTAAEREHHSCHPPLALRKAVIRKKRCNLADDREEWKKEDSAVAKGATVEGNHSTSSSLQSSTHSKQVPHANEVGEIVSEIGPPPPPKFPLKPKPPSKHQLLMEQIKASIEADKLKPKKEIKARVSLLPPPRASTTAAEREHHRYRLFSEFAPPSFFCT
ncbi:hypothetical protein OSTOST_04921 [Ostertagia ostertagi]